MTSFLDFLDLTKQFTDKDNNNIILTGKVDTSFSLIEARTIHLDRLFSLSDGSLLIFEIDSTSKRENYFRYINYAWGVAQHYAKESNYNSYPLIRLCILHTGQEKYPTFPNCPTTGLVPFIPEVKWIKELDYCGDDVLDEIVRELESDEKNTFKKPENVLKFGLAPFMKLKGDEEKEKEKQEQYRKDFCEKCLRLVTSKEVKNLPGANDVIAYASVASLHFLKKDFIEDLLQWRLTVEELQQFINNLSGGEWDATFAELAEIKELNRKLGLTIRQKEEESRKLLRQKEEESRKLLRQKEENRKLKIAAIEPLHKIGMPADDIAQRLRFSKKEVEAVIRSLPSS
jgi:hypothetical protein